MPQPLSSGEIINWVRSRAAPAVLDGGLASMLEAAGVDTAGSLWSFRAMLEAPGEIEAATRAFLCAGADIVSTATYQASHETLVASSISADDAASLMLRAVALTVHVRDEFVAARTTPCAPRRQPLVALSLGPWGAAQSGGLEYTGEYPTDYHTCERIEQFHACRAKALFSVKLDHDLPDIVAFETIPITLEAKIVATMMVSGAHSLHCSPLAAAHRHRCELCFAPLPLLPRCNSTQEDRNAPARWYVGARTTAHNTSCCLSEQRRRMGSPRRSMGLAKSGQAAACQGS
jgi:hypothetical protein